MRRVGGLPAVATMAADGTTTPFSSFETGLLLVAGAALLGMAALLLVRWRTGR